MNLDIKTRLWLFTGTAAASLVALWVATWLMATTMRDQQALVTAELAKATLLRDAAALLQQLDEPGNAVLASRDHHQERANLQRYDVAFAEHERLLEEGIADDPTLRDGVRELRPHVRELVAKATAVMDEVAAAEEADDRGDPVAAEEASARASARMAEMDGQFASANDVLRRLDVAQRSRISTLLDGSASLNRRAVSAATIVTLVALLFNLGMAVVLVRSITRPVDEALRIARRIADGDLRETATVDGEDEMARLLRAMNHMAGNLRQLLGDLRAGVAQLSTSSVAIGATAAQYAASSAEQATSVAEISATVEEIKQTSAAAAAAARDVAEGGDDAAERGREGRERLDHAVRTVGVIDERVRSIAAQILRLSEQTAQIGEIVESVNDLAEQSNLLAVNASIEAAKAGEHGRGFAVVASEVRSLAEQSKRATQQIRSILVDIQKATHGAVLATEEGTKRADDGRQAIERLRELVDALAGTLEDASGKGRQIAGAASQQATGIAQIAVAMDGVSRAGQDNAAGVRQLDQAVRDLGTLAGELRRTSERFQVA